MPPKHLTIFGCRRVFRISSSRSKRERIVALATSGGNSLTASRRSSTTYRGRYPSRETPGTPQSVDRCRHDSSSVSRSFPHGVQPLNSATLPRRGVAFDTDRRAAAHLRSDEHGVAQELSVPLAIHDWQSGSNGPHYGGWNDLCQVYGVRAATIGRRQRRFAIWAASREEIGRRLDRAPGIPSR